MSLFGRKEGDAMAAASVPPPHPALASIDALTGAPLRDLAVAVLVAGIAPHPPGTRLTASEVYGRIKEAVCGSLPGLDSHDFDRRCGDVVPEGLQVLEQSLILRIWPIGSELVVFLNRRAHEALESGDPGRFIVVPEGAL
jgi:hypothetical protein